MRFAENTFLELAEFAAITEVPFREDPAILLFAGRLIQNRINLFAATSVLTLALDSPRLKCRTETHNGKAAHE